MSLLFFKVALWATASCVCVASALPNLEIHETAGQVPSGWTRLGEAVPSTILHLSIALKQPGLGDLRIRLDATSNPEHEHYGQHVTQKELRAFRQPEVEAVDTVLQWLRDSDIEHFALDGARVKLNATIAAANSLLQCRLEPYASPDSGIVYRATEYSLPKKVAKHVDFVYPVTQFMRSPKRSPAPEKRHLSAPRIEPRQGTTLPQSCWSAVTPNCLVDLYGVNYIPQDNLSSSSLGIAGFLEQYPSNAYVHEFLTYHSPRRNVTGYSPNDYSFTVESIAGGNATDKGSGVEAMLDTDYVMAFTQPLPVVYYSTGGRGPKLDENGTLSDPSQSDNEPWLEFLEALLAKDPASLPQVLSISYTDDEQSIPTAYAMHVCDLFMQLTSLGVSVIIASGDGGAAGIRSSNQCYSNDGAKTPQFLPTFPVDCPYVTGVGGTANYVPTEPGFYSSGGFSNYFARPAWQETAATGYMAKLNGSHAGFYNASGRGIPDIAVAGSKYLLRGDVFEWTQTGTSAGTPVFAAMIALVNDARLRKGKSVLGFLNPILYSDKVAAAQAFTDVVSGQSGSCTFGGQVEFGWQALTGWDAATGLGTPDFGKLMGALVDV
jgi:tripeptidyl-peptidase-1